MAHQQLANPHLCTTTTVRVVILTVRGVRIGGTGAGIVGTQGAVTIHAELQQGPQKLLRIGIGSKNYKFAVHDKVEVRNR